MGLKVATVNINGLRQLEKRSLFFSWCRRESLDIILLQETHVTDQEDINTFTTHWGQTSFWSLSDSRAGGVAFLLSRKAAALPHQLLEINPHLAILRMDINGTTTELVNLYAPVEQPAATAAFYDSLCARQWDLGISHIMAGDFNVVLNPALDRPGQATQKASTHGLASLIDTLGVEDLWRRRNPLSRETTHHSRSTQGGARLDRIYTPPLLAPWISGLEHQIHGISDHDAVVMTIKENSKTTSPYWKLNTSLLQEQECRDLVRAVIAEVSDIPYANARDLWDRLKADLRTAIKALASSRALALKQQRTSVINDIKNLETRPTLSKEERIRASKLRYDLKEIDLRLLRGAAIRSRAAWLTNGEKPSRLFSSLERSRKEASRLHKVKDPQGSTLTNPKQVRERVRSFYQDLYTASQTDPTAQAVILSRVQPTLDPISGNSCEGELTLDELSKAAKYLPSNRAPGPDGLPAEFYKEFWPELGPILLRVANEAFRAGLLPASQRTGYITLIPKKGDLEDLGNWRPITLLNADYKAISKAVYNRLAAVAPLVIGSHQAATPKRFIHTQTRLIQDIVDMATPLGRDGGILFLDQQKAFDRVDWAFLDAVLAKKGFGPGFLRWISTLRNQGRSRVIVNGLLTRPFQLSRGVRQGDPLSPLLYCIAIEALADAILSDPTITGFTLPGTPHKAVKVVMFADDTALPFASAPDLSKIAHWISQYEKASGALVNTRKSVGLAFTGDPNRFRQYFDAPWQTPNTPITYLGVQVGHRLDPELHWQPVLEKVDRSLKTWSNHYLSTAGMKTVANTYALSKAWYTAAFTPLTPTAAAALCRMIAAFARRGKKSGIVAAAWFHTPRAQGGLGLLNPQELSAMIAARMLRRLIRDADLPWTRLPWWFVDMEAGALGHGKATLFCQNRTPPGSPLSPFWAAAVRHLRTRASLPPINQLTPDQIYSLPLWGNPLLCWKDAPLSDLKWRNLIANSTIRHCYQLFHADGTPKDFGALLKDTTPALNFVSRTVIYHLVQLAKDLEPQIHGFMPPTSRLETALVSSPPPLEWFNWSSDPKPAPPPRYGLAPDVWTRLLRRAHLRTTAPKWNDLFLRLLHGTMALGYHQHPAKPCLMCDDHPETPQHLFMECKRARDALVSVNARLNSLNAPLLTYSSWENFLLQPVASSSRKPARRRKVLVEVAHRALLFAIWVHRDNLRRKADSDLLSILDGILHHHTLAMGTVPGLHFLLLL